VTFSGKFERVGIVGCGLMGSGIAEVTANAGLDVVVLEANQAAVDAGRARIEKSLANAVRRNKTTQELADAAFARIRLTDEFEALEDRELVIEAVPEIEPLKLDTFRTIDKVLSDSDAVLASNTSSIPIMKLAMATGRPEKVIGIHFFNPVPVLPLVELVPSLLTAPVVVNALLIPYILSAIRMLESGFATAEDIDTGMVQGCAHPMGPLALADLIGTDTVMAVAVSMYEEFKEPLYAPPPMLLRMVDAGLLGRKTGRGFHRYP
jgi:3-hydroxybutyryl-CoA dehydrogenase